MKTPTSTLSRVYNQFMKIYFYPLCLVASFHSYAFEQYGKLMISMLVMTVIASISEVDLYIKGKHVEALEDVANG